MKARALSMRCSVSVCVTLIIVAGCSGSQLQTNSFIPPQYSAAGGSHGEPGAEDARAETGAGGSWMASDAKRQDLVYVAHATDGSIDAYSYPAGKLEGRLLDVDADGLCSGKNGNVFVPEGDEIREYAHGGARPVAVLRDPLGAAFQFCAVDPVTGNLAVSGGAHPESGIAIYANAKGNPRLYKGGGVNGGFWSCTYDDDGNLFLEGITARLGTVRLVELPKGGERLRSVAWSGIRPQHLGSIQWDGEYLAVQSASSGSTATSLLRYNVSARRAALAGRTTLRDAGSPLQFWIHAGNVVVPNQGPDGSAGVLFYGYPAGGKPTQIIQDAHQPRAATVSLVQNPKFAVTTYHYDNFRTGWNPDETSLTYNTVSGSSFGLLHTVTLDDQVDAQPLIVPNEKTTRGTAPGKHDVVYVATENDTIYAIDASSGTVLFDQHLGSPVPTPLGCNNNGPNVGINGTPVIDQSANVMYVIAYTLDSGTPTYRIHELDLADLSDVVPPVVVSASHSLTDGSTFEFNATYQRQRPGLLESHGNIYAGFGSFCDFNASSSRGWLLGWQTGSLTPLAANRLNDVLATSPDSFFLSSIWMSGYGVAADPAGDVYFATGNSDYSGNTYNSVTNLSESIVKVSSDLTQVLSFFTPSDVSELDIGDTDTGSGGVMLLPPGTSATPTTPLAVAAGKEGTMFLLNRNSLGGYTPSGPNDDLAEEQIGGCWCGESYFNAASDSVPRLVASGGNNLTVWKVQNSPTANLTLAASSSQLPGAQDPGFFTTVSSDANGAGAIIWALARPQTIPGNLTLYAFESEAQTSAPLATLYQGNAGSWVDYNGNADLVPVVANGKVYVASYQQLDIFGIGGSLEKPASVGAPGLGALRSTIGAAHEVTGTLLAIKGSKLTLRTRTGRVVRVDASEARRRERSAVLVLGKPFYVSGTYDAAGVLHAAAIVRAKRSQATWPADR
jgi:hypothetical protein